MQCSERLAFTSSLVTARGIDKLMASDESKLFAILTPQLLRSDVQTHGSDGTCSTPPTSWRYKLERL